MILRFSIAIRYLANIDLLIVLIMMNDSFMLTKISILEIQSDSQKFVLGIGIYQALKMRMMVFRELIAIQWSKSLYLMPEKPTLWRLEVFVILGGKNYLNMPFQVQMDMSHLSIVHNADALPVKML